MDSTSDTPIILTEEFANQAAQGICDALVEVYSLKTVGQMTGEQTTYTTYDGVHDFAVPVSAFTLELIDADKNNCGQNYVNAGYFGNYSEGLEPFTLPSGHLVANLTASSQWVRHYIKERGKLDGDKAIFDSFSWSFLNPFYQKEVSVLLVKGGVAYIQEVQELPACDFAVAGVPVLRGGKKTTTGQALAQGWDKSSLRATCHIFVGLNGDGRVHVLGLQTKAANLLDSGEVGNLLAAHGYTDVIKLDGGGSYIIRSDVANADTSGSRRICSIIRMGPVVKGDVIVPPGEMDQEENAGYTLWKRYMERYRAELAAFAASMPDLVQEAKNMGLTDGTRPRDFCTREEAQVMARAAALYKK